MRQRSLGQVQLYLSRAATASDFFKHFHMLMQILHTSRAATASGFFKHFHMLMQILHTSRAAHMLILMTTVIHEGMRCDAQSDGIDIRDSARRSVDDTALQLFDFNVCWHPEKCT